MERLLERGLKHFKFVDRTFNLNLNVSRTILEFFLERYRPGHFFHFEMVPDRLPEQLQEVLRRFPHGALQFEVGVQTFNEEVAARIHRRQNYAKLEENLRFLRNETGVHIHADLIAGLPGETLESFAAGFDRLVQLGPHEIQVGVLKRLRGTPIVRHDDEWRMVYNCHPPYEILENKLLDFATVQRLRRFARYWDLVGNSGNFIESAPLLWSKSPDLEAGAATDSPFYSFLRWGEWLHAKIRRTDGIALVRLTELLFDYLTTERRLPAETIAGLIWRDYQRCGRSDVPPCLRSFVPASQARGFRSTRSALPKRQARHSVRSAG
jgi:hypothetical protein